MTGQQGEFYPHKDLTATIIGVAFRVHNRLGPFFLEKVYENALVKELEALGIRVEQQKRLAVNYGGEPIGNFIVDVLVDQKVIVEVKAVPSLLKAHTDKLLHYLKASGVEVGLVLNFSASVQIKRVIFTNHMGQAN